MWMIIIALLLLFHTSLGVDLTYHVEEGQVPGTYVGDIAADTHLLESFPPKEHHLITFSLLQESTASQSQLFNVSKTGKLYTAQTLDAETLCKYNTKCFNMLEIAVQHKQSFLKILEVRVIIVDVNDHKPEFPQDRVEIKLSEDFSKGTRRLIPNAIDKDVGSLNSQITYQLKNLNDPFMLLASKKEDNLAKLEIISKEKLDREVKDSYQLQVIAKDGGSPSQHSILNVQVFVTDENDNPPVFSQKLYNISIKKSHRRDMPIVSLSATDIDSKENKQISYKFNSKTSDVAKSYFQVNSKTGEVFLGENFPFDKRQTYQLLIDAQDSGNPPLTSTAVVVVNVINQQNNAPKIDVKFVSKSKGNTATISEGLEIGSFIAYVKVIDNDMGRNGEVSCELNHDKFQLQSLGRRKYKAVIKNKVDRESKRHFEFKIVCTDEGSPPLQTVRNFSIQVMDVNDVRPRFTKDVFKFLTYENEKPNFPVGFINATDPDLGSGGQLSYFILNDNEGMLPFKISNFGFISTTQSLDHEQQDIYKFKILVKDNGDPSLNNTADVIVEVMDENDNAPYFTFPSVDPFSLDVHHHPQSKNDITVLRASDRDSRENAFLRYEILGGNEKQLFTINPFSGALSFSRIVYQNDAGSYILQFAVKDSGTPVLSATTTLSLTLTVSNKTSRMFTRVDVQSDKMIHINLVIIIVVAAVIVSMAIVVSIAVCLIRRNSQRNIQYCDGEDPSNKFLGESKQSELVCKQMSPKYDIPVPIVTDLGSHRNSLATLLRRESHSTYKSDDQWKGIQPQPERQEIHQVAILANNQKSF
ncbi:protocadherin gamma-B4-like [Octopus vulgaris]|uniref:Protocadherin gamma-B4-like n=1 Tax=Octopus vulgaris TaxID=6645 RepID=A0AA36BDE0_OCTVU|nr:protocadherin gamma-B4-like [Octopus vulgaris]